MADYLFDADMFIETTKKIVGDQSYRRFAAYSQIGYNHFLRLMTGKDEMKRQPQISTVDKIAAQTENGDLIKTLYRSAGFPCPSFDEPAVDQYAKSQLKRLERYRNEITWRQSPGKDSRHLDYLLSNAPIDSWRLIELGNKRESDTLQDLVLQEYGRLALTYFSGRTKVTILTQDKDAYEYMVSCPPLNLNLIVDACLIDRNRKLLRCQFLPSAYGPVPEDVKALFPDAD